MGVRKQNEAQVIALGGVLAALAVVVMSLGGLIPIATYVCPMVCCILLAIVVKNCGTRIAWAWYGAVAVLGLLLGPDKEAAAVFCFIGYYPILKPRIDRFPVRWLWKMLLFNVSILSMYWILMNLMGMKQLSGDFAEFGKIGVVIMLFMGNVIFFMLDKLLGMLFYRSKK